MEAKRSIRSYIGVGAALPLAALLALLAAVVCLSFALRGVLASDQVQEYAPFSTREAMSGSIYLDVLGISEPLHSEEGRAFYVAESAEHEYCLVCLSRTSLDELGAQRSYWDAQSTVSLPFRLMGRSAEIPAAVEKTICGIFEMDAESFSANFGTRCFFDEPPEPEKAPSVRVGLLVLGVVFFVLLVLALVLLVLRLSSVANALVRLEEADALGAAADELEAVSTEIVDGDRLRLGERYVFGWRNGLAASWEDLVWCGEKLVPFRSLTLARVLLLGTADGKSHAVVFPAEAEKELRLLVRRFTEKNPKLTVRPSRR